MDQQPTILVLVSHPVVGELTAYRLRLLGMRPVVVPDVAALQSRLADSLPQLIMIDLDLANVDAMQITEGLTSDEITSRIPVICMSAEGDLAKAEQAFSFGAIDFLVVPYDPIVLENKVSEALAKAESRRRQETASEVRGLVARSA